MKESEEKPSSRARLLEAAGEVFGEVGFKAATIREITRRAEMNVAAVNYYFRDKAELYSAVLQHAQRCAVETAGVGSGSAEERLRDFIGGMMRHVLDPLRPAWHGRLMAREMAEPTRMPHNLIDGVFRPKVDLLDGILRDLSDERLSDEEIARASASIVSQCLFYRQNRPFISRLYPELLGDEAHIEKLAEHIASFSLGGIERLKESSPEKLSIAML
jgi:AcrR family transcriptional regulator